MKTPIFLIVLLIAGGIPAEATTTFVVNTTADHDDGSCDVLNTFLVTDCTLREAINAANNTVGADTINFNIPTTDTGYNPVLGWWTITLNPLLVGTLPNLGLPNLIDDGTTINGLSQPGSYTQITSDRPGVLDAGNTCPTLSFTKPTIAINASKVLNPVVIDGDASFITIKGLSIYNADGGQATDPDGNAILGLDGTGTNRLVTQMFIGVLPNGADPDPSANPLGLRNAGYGVHQFSPGVLSTTISYVGFNGMVGVNGQSSFSTITVLNNEVFGNGWNSNSHDGIDVNGENSIVRCNLTRENTTIGTPNGGGGNGIELGSTRRDPGLDNNLIEYNSSYDNISSGISIRRGPRGNVIQKNVIHGNEVAISVNVENTVADGFPTNRNKLSRNSTYQNMNGFPFSSVEGTGIDLQGEGTDITTWMLFSDGVTLNDDCDPDGNPAGCGTQSAGSTDGDPSNTDSNDLQNFPNLTAADVSGSQVRIQGQLNSWPNRMFLIEFFATPTADSQGREGEFFLKDKLVTTDGFGNATFDTGFFTPANSADVGDLITATATAIPVAGQPAGPGSTSEYSGPVPANNFQPAGKVTGGGYIQPQAVTCNTPCTNAGDKRANFGFVAQYKHQTDGVPQGHINFVWNPGNIHFGSTSYLLNSLNVTRFPNGNGFADWKGQGKLNKQSGYCFHAYVHDNGEPGSADTFRIKIWQKTDADCTFEDPGTIKYDTVTEWVLVGGNIQIHHP